MLVLSICEARIMGFILCNYSLRERALWVYLGFGLCESGLVSFL